MRIIRRTARKTLSILLILAIVLALSFGAFSLIFAARPITSRAKDTEEFRPTDAGISNCNFADTSGEYPATPNGWTGNYVGSGSGNVISGVVDLTPSAYVGENSGNKKFKLDQYPEYADDSLTPKTIFDNSIEYPGADAKTLLINTAEGARTAYAYSSDSITLNANSYYRFSVWVKTGDFAPDTGATVKINGLGKSCSFNNINTVASLAKSEGIPVLNKDNRFGWVKYSIYVRTSSSLSKSVTLALGIGDAYTEKDEAPAVTPTVAHGYAFFDTVKAERISAYDFAFETQYYDQVDPENRPELYADSRGTSIALDLFDTEYLTDELDNDIGTFSNGAAGWDLNPKYKDDDKEETVYLGPSTVYTYDSYRVIDPEDNTFGFKSNPWAPLGRAEGYNLVENSMFTGTNGNIVAISTYNSAKKSYETAARGIASPDVEVSRFGYYRFGVWVKDVEINGGNGISVGIKGQTNNNSTDNKLDQWYSNVTGDPDENATYGWKEHVVYIKGSALSDLKIHFELWLGAPDGKSSGIALFDNVTFKALSYSEYSSMSSVEGANVLSLDASLDDTGVSNGSFMDIGDIDDEQELPLPAAEWTFQTTDNVKANGFSLNKVDAESAVYGIIPTDDETFNEIATGKLATLPNPSRFVDAPVYNVLVLASPDKTAFSYKSSDITVATDKSYKLTVTLAAGGVTDGGYGASIVLKTNDGNVISTIEGIKNTHNAFKTYTFYIEGPLSDKTVNVELWLGMNDRTNNTQKLSDGYVYIKEVAMTEWSGSDDDPLEAQFNSIRDKYLADINNPALIKSLDYGVFSFKTPTFNYYDVYSYNMLNDYATPYMWSKSSDESASVSGVFATENMRGLLPYSSFDKKDLDGNMLLINNAEANRTVYTYDNTLSLVSNTYYRLDVTVKVHTTDEQRNNDNVVGAQIGITGAVSESFDNIKDTSTLVAQNNEDSRDRETFKTYTFFISTGAEGGDLGITIAFGGTTKASRIQGQLIVADVSLSSITNTIYENSVKSLTDYQKAVELSEKSEDDDSDNTEAAKGDIAWWIIPTVIFSVALVAAILIILIIRLRDRFKRKKKTTYTSEYDRAATAKHIDKLKAAEEADKKAKEKAAEAKTETPEETPSDEATESDEEKAEEPAEEKPAKEEKAVEEEKPTDYEDLND